MMADKAVLKKFSKIVKGLQTNELEAYKESYQFFDPTGKGYITREDFADAIRRMGQAPTEDELDDLCKEYDATGDGKVTFEELLVAVVRRKEGPGKIPERRRVNQGLRK